jgi:hypothetical protein
MEGVVDGTEGTPKDDGANKANNPKMSGRGAAPVSTKQHFSFWNLLNYQLLLFYINYLSSPFLFLT